MAGHRAQTGRPRHSDTRAARNRQRLAAAGTAEEQLAAAFDWLRMVLRRTADPALRARVMREHAQALAQSAADLEGSHSGSTR